MADWDALTRGWVDEGLVTEAQRGPLLERLVALRTEAPSRPGLPIGPIVTLLVAGAAWLLTGSLVTLLLLLDLNDEQVVGALVAASGAASLALGGLMRGAPKLLPLARGFLAAAPPLLTLGAMPLVGDTRASAVVMAPGLLGLALTLVEGSRATSATASLALTSAAVFAIETTSHDTVWASVAFPAAAVTLAAVALASRFVPSRSEVLEVMVPAGVLFLAIDVCLTGTHFEQLWAVAMPGGPTGQGWVLEKCLELLAAGAFLVVVGAVARSGWMLVPALGLVAGATIGVATVFGSWIGGTVALALLGGAFLAGASLLWVLRSRDREHEVDQPQQGR